MPNSAITLDFVYSNIHTVYNKKYTEYTDDPHAACILACSIRTYIWIPFSTFNNSDIQYMLSRHKEDCELHGQLISNIFFRARISQTYNGFLLSVKDKFTKQYLQIHVHKNWPYMFCPIADTGKLYA
jgi:hypothetical protein